MSKSHLEISVTAKFTWKLPPETEEEATLRSYHNRVADQVARSLEPQVKALMEAELQKSYWVSRRPPGARRN